MMKKVGLIKGDGIGPEISEFVIKIFKKMNVPLEFVEIPIGEKYHQNKMNPLNQDSLMKINELKTILKAPLMTPIGDGFSSINVALRKKYNLDINYRPVKSIKGIETPFDNIDIVTIRENMQGMYVGEGQSNDGKIAKSISIMDKEKLKIFFKRSYEILEREGRKKITIVHKANILKSTSGMFLKVGMDIAKDFPNLVVDDMIVDATAMNLVKNPQYFDSIITSNLFGDILSDLCAGLVGGLGVASGANLGKEYAIFEAVHGTAPDIVGKDLANPTAFILSACLMLDYLNLKAYSDKIRKNSLFMFRE
jgi:isocitrate dehydrogenase (NAD+)